MGAYQTIVVGTDGSATSFAAVQRAGEIARDSDASLVIVCAYVADKVDTAAQDALGDESYQVVGSAPADDTVSRARDRAAAAGATRVDTVSVQGKPAASLTQTVADRGAGLLVVGNVGLNTLAGRILGSVPLDVARHAGCDVLVVHTS